MSQIEGLTQGQDMQDDLNLNGMNSLSVNGDESKLSTDNQVYTRLLVSNKVVGTLIGKGGQTVKLLREETGAYVNIEAAIPGADKRIVTVKGTVSQAAAAVHVIGDKLAARKNENRQHQGERDHDKMDDDLVSILLLVSASCVGSLIGHSGTTINATRQTSGANIKVSNNLMDHSTEKSVSITGTSDAVHKAVVLIFTQLLQAALVNGSGDTAASMRPRSAYHPMPVVPQMMQNMGNGYHNAMLGGNMMNGGGTTTAVVTVAESDVGAIIGRAGSVINDIRKASNCDVKIAPKDNNNEFTRAINITGTRQGVELATAFISNIIQQQVAMSSHKSHNDRRNNNNNNNRQQQQQQNTDY